MLRPATPNASVACRKQAGVGLIEILVAVLVTGIGILGLAGLHGRVQQAEAESYQRAQAMFLLDDMSNRLRANRAASDCYDLAGLGIDYLGTGSGFTQGNCDPTADADLTAWHEALLGAAETQGEARVGAMLGARGCIVGNGAGSFVVTVAWQGFTENQVDESADSNDLRRTNDCGQNLYGSEAQRRIMSTVVRFATLS
jgi:type IV pilus assembly protein PilV